MAKPKPRALIAVLIDAKFALDLSQRELAERLGSSARTASRWMARQSSPMRSQLEELAALLFPIDALLAAEVALHAGKTLEQLGLVVAGPPPPPALPPSRPAEDGSPPPKPSMAMEPPRVTSHEHLPEHLPEHLVDGIVCVAAEAMNLPPHALRPSLLAAFRRARVLGLTADVVEACLASG
jgi:transcriptional regulator with XRE-family HTH domain